MLGTMSTTSREHEIDDYQVVTSSPERANRQRRIRVARAFSDARPNGLIIGSSLLACSLT